MTSVAPSSHPPQLPLHHRPRLRRHQIPERIRRIIAADAILVGIHLQHILRPIRIVLQRRQTFQQPRTPLMNEQPSAGTPFPGSPSRCRISAHPFTRSVFAHRQRNPELPVLRRHCRAIALPAEHIRPRHKPSASPPVCIGSDSLACAVPACACDRRAHAAAAATSAPRVHPPRTYSHPHPCTRAAPPCNA